MRCTCVHDSRTNLTFLRINCKNKWNFDYSLWRNFELIVWDEKKIETVEILMKKKLTEHNWGLFVQSFPAH